MDNKDSKPDNLATDRKEPGIPPGGKTERTGDTTRNSSFAIQIPSIDTPKGGGALKNIDEKFRVNVANGTASFNLPLPFSKTRGDLSPLVSLGYNSGSGNSVFGQGWSLDFPGIQRKTDKKLPRYQDATGSDVFLFTGGEDLVPTLKLDGGGHWVPDEFTALTGENIKRYRPRVEGDFSRIERIALPGQVGCYWKVTDRNNHVTFFGRSAGARIADPGDASRIFKWLPELSFDDKGNCFEWVYTPENLLQVPNSLSEKNRFSGLAPFVNTYLKRIKYGNKTPYYLDPEHPYNPASPADPQYFFETVLDYGDHDADNPTVAVQHDWACREDPFSDYKPGFDLRTYRLCTHVLFFHYFKELNDGVNAAPCLVRSLDISYRYFNNPAALPAEVRNAETDYILSIRRTGYSKNGGGYDKKSLPPIAFSYQELNWNKTVQAISPENILQSPVGLGANYKWVDLWGEGISGILTEQGGGWYYKRNLGDGKFSAARAITPRPSFTGLAGGTLQLQDLEADGRKFLVATQGPASGYFEVSDDEAWLPFRPFDQSVNIDSNDPNCKFIDLDGDGKAELIVSEENVFTWYENKGTRGYAPAQRVPKPFEEEKGPALVFRDPVQSIFLADMNGDGLTDIVRIRNGEIAYWPNRGYGNFGAKITMEQAPVFDLPDHFNPAYLHIADVSGTGAADILYLGRNQFRAWINRCGNAWGDVMTIDAFPDASLSNQLSVADLLGNGTACIIWSSPLPQYADRPLRYIDLMGGNKPYIMNGYQNNFGKKVDWEYKSSSYYYLKDTEKGQPWVTKLPFPVQCVSKMTITEEVTHAYFSSEYSYHHGYYDHPEREFRGFGRVEQKDSEQYDDFVRNNGSNIVDRPLFQDPVLIKTWYHNGGYFGREKVLDQFTHEYFKNPVLPEHSLPDDPLPPSLRFQETREALRACKNKLLRQEIYSIDSSSGVLSAPYSTARHNCRVHLIQPLLDNRNAVFLVTESESISYSYEKNTSDPRIAHNLNITFDEYGNVLQAASLAYPRQVSPAGLPAPVPATQQQMLINYTVSTYGNDIIRDNAYRLRLPADQQVFELTGVIPSGAYFSIQDLADGFAAASPVSYEVPPDGTRQKRKISHQRTLYRRDDAITALGLGTMDTLGLIYESYQLAYTSSLLNGLYGAKASLPDLTGFLAEGKYTRSNDYKGAGLFPAGDANEEWWVPSGREGYPVNPSLHFYQPDTYADPFGNITRVEYYGDYHLLIARITDAVSNAVSVGAFDWRHLQAQSVKGINDNYTELRYDRLGIVVGAAHKGKGNEADDLDHFNADLSDGEINAFFADPVTQARAILQHASTCYVYDLTVWPVRVASVTREQHTQDSDAQGNPSSLQLAFEYSDGLGHVAMKKVQTKPGEVKQLDASNNVVTVSTFPNLRWIGNGRTVLNNKGNPVKQYEPYFSAGWVYEDDKKLVEIGVSPVLYYDALGRVIKKVFPDGSFSHTVFDSWIQRSYDPNDTVQASDWYVLRTTGSLAGDVLQNQAAVKAAMHQGTPVTTHLDTMGREFYGVAHNKFKDHQTGVIREEFYETHIFLDIEGKPLQMTDPRNLAVMQYAYGMRGAKAFQRGVDNGQRWMLADAAGKPLRAWTDNTDNHGSTTVYLLSYDYDALRRPTAMYVQAGAGAKIQFEKIIYGEGQLDDKIKNLRGKPYQHFDSAGVITQLQFDFKENLLQSTRVFTVDDDRDIDWQTSPILQTETFTSQAVYDALNRPYRQMAPYINPAGANTLFMSYNEGGQLESVEANLRGEIARTHFVKHIDYNEKNQRSHIQYGNDVVTNYQYDPLTLRLTRLSTTRHAGADILQDLSYYYDPVGNITYTRDDAQDTIFFLNKKVEPSADYTYDAVYRLTEALGREHMGQQATADGYDARRMFNPQPGDGNQMQAYRQQYTYDVSGNMGSMKNVGGWDRQFSYSPANNRLLTAQPSQPPAPLFTYACDLHGNLLATPHLPQMEWNFQDQLQHIMITAAVENDQSQQAWYRYDAAGQRARKRVLKDNVTEIRYYLGAVELFRKYRNGVLELERETLQVMDDKQRIALVDTPAVKPGSSHETRLIRYQLSNHLGSACLELDDGNAGTTLPQIISYEEYYPFGSTSYQAVDQGREVAAKRYRYTGKERDEETGFYYHGARYYAPWLARWTAADPTGIKDGPNMYAYVGNNPVIKTDPHGTQSRPHQDPAPTPPDASGNQAPSRTRPAPTTPNPAAQAPSDGQSAPPPQSGLGAGGQTSGWTGLSATSQYLWLNATGGSGSGLQTNYGVNRGVSPPPRVDGMELFANLALPGNASVEITGLSASAGVHVWYGPKSSRFLLGGYLSLSHTTGQNPPNTSTNFGGVLTVAPELHLGGHDSEHSPVVLGANVTAGWQQFAQVTQTGGRAPSAFVPNPLSISESFNVTVNPAYYPNESTVSYVSMFLEATFGGIVNGGSIGSNRFVTLGTGFSVNFRYDHTIFTLGAAAIYRGQEDRVGESVVRAQGVGGFLTGGLTFH